jgi:hypothetical protein
VNTETPKTIEELANELGQLIAYNKVIDLLIYEIGQVGSISGRLDRSNEYAEQRAVLEVLQVIRKDVVDLVSKVGA